MVINLNYPLCGMDPNLRAKITPYQAFNLGERHTLVYNSSNPLMEKVELHTKIS